MGDAIALALIGIIVNSAVLYFVVKAAILDAIMKSGLMNLLDAMHDDQSAQTAEIVSKLNEIHKQ